MNNLEYYIDKYGSIDGPKKYKIYIEWKKCEEKRRQDPNYILRRNKRSSEIHKLHKTDKRKSLYYTIKLPKRNRYKVYSFEYEKIENYSAALADNFIGWVCHHRLELHPDNSIRFTRDSLIKLDLYVNRPANELIFLKAEEHNRIHGVNRWK